MIQKESQARIIGYGGMLTKSFVAMAAMITACVIDQHMYFGMNASLGLTGGTPETVAKYTNGLGLVSPGGQPLPPASPEMFSQAAQEVGETTIISRTGGAPTLAFGMAQIFGEIPLIGAAKAFWYHFAVMFEALFILTTIDAGTGVARFMIGDMLANVPGLKRFGDPSWRTGAWITTLLTVVGWGSIVVMGVTDPLGGINMLFPLLPDREDPARDRHGDPQHLRPGHPEHRPCDPRAGGAGHPDRDQGLAGWWSARRRDAPGGFADLHPLWLPRDGPGEGGAGAVAGRRTGREWRTP